MINSNRFNVDICSILIFFSEFFKYFNNSTIKSSLNDIHIFWMCNRLSSFNTSYASFKFILSFNNIIFFFIILIIFFFFFFFLLFISHFFFIFFFLFLFLLLVLVKQFLLLHCHDVSSAFFFQGLQELQLLLLFFFFLAIESTCKLFEVEVG